MRSAMFDLQRIVGEYQRSDFRWALAFDSFAEDQYAEFDPTGGQPPFTAGIEARFGLSHSFEYLTAVGQSRVAWADTTGNPLVVVNESTNGRGCYLNTCGHSCLNSMPVLSPLEDSPAFGVLLRNVIEWLVEEKTE